MTTQLREWRCVCHVFPRQMLRTHAGSAAHITYTTYTHRQLSIPDVRVLPLFCDIPYQIKIVTTTAPLTAAKAQTCPLGKPVFPAPPSAHTDINFKVCQRVYIRAKRFTAMGESDVAFILGEGTDPSKPQPAVVMEAPPRVWTPLKAQNEKEKGGADEHGVWVQKVKLASNMRITIPPSFATRLIHCEVRPKAWRRIAFWRVLMVAGAALPLLAGAVRGDRERREASCADYDQFWDRRTDAARQAGLVCGRW